MWTIHSVFFVHVVIKKPTSYIYYVWYPSPCTKTLKISNDLHLLNYCLPLTYCMCWWPSPLPSNNCPANYYSTLMQQKRRWYHPNHKSEPQYCILWLKEALVWASVLNKLGCNSVQSGKKAMHTQKTYIC